MDPAEEIVNLWLQGQGFFIMSAAKVGYQGKEIDFLGDQPDRSIFLFFFRGILFCLQILREVLFAIDRQTIVGGIAPSKFEVTVVAVPGTRPGIAIPSVQTSMSTTT